LELPNICNIHFKNIQPRAYALNYVTDGRTDSISMVTLSFSLCNNLLLLSF